MIDTRHTRRRRLNHVLDLLAIGGPIGAADLIGREVHESGQTCFADLAELLDLGCVTLKGGVYTWASRLPDPYELPADRDAREAALAARRAEVAACEHVWSHEEEAGRGRVMQTCSKCHTSRYSDSSD